MTIAKTYTLKLTLPDKQAQEFKVSKRIINLGRSVDNDVVLEDDAVSRHHACLIQTGAGFTIKDRSSNGTQVNGEFIDQAILNPGDAIEIGRSTLELQEDGLEFESTIVRTVPEQRLEVPKTLIEPEIMTTTIVDTSLDRIAVFTPEVTWEVTFETDCLEIGRHRDSDIILQLPGVSVRHARIERRGNDIFVKDLNSTNGTMVDGDYIKEIKLKNRAAIQISSAQLVFKRGFKLEDLTFLGAPLPLSQGRRQPVVIVPGICGSELWRGSERVWPNVKLMLNNPESFALPDETPLEPRGILSDLVIVPNFIKLEQYGRLRDYLHDSLGYELGRDLFEFTYDWRKDVRKASARLAQRIEEWDIRSPITIIAHSMGCLVSRYYVEHLGGKHKVGRLLLIGGPQHGAPQALNLIHKGVNVLPFGIMSERLRGLLASFPSLYQLLPTYPCVFDKSGRKINVLKDSSWVEEKYRGHLKAARHFRWELGTKSSVPTVSIFGYGMKTILRVDADRAEDGSWNDAKYTMGMAGDQTVPEFSAVLDNRHIHPVAQYHGSLYVDPDVKMRLKLELMKKA